MASRSVLRFRAGGQADLPLLVPSFSSKGFAFFTDGTGKGRRIVSETTIALEEHSKYLNESLLISAYDLFHGHFKRPIDCLENTAICFLDSGGYELTPDFDSSEPKITAIRQLDFSSTDYENVLEDLASSRPDLPLVISNYDWGNRGKSYADQIAEAQAFFTNYPQWLSNIILKPEKADGTVVHVTPLIPEIENLREFDVIGVTEKELGKGLWDRLKRLARLRTELNKRQIQAPVHVWGGLDPVVTPLYFFAGGDIFDGVSWLRYAYQRGLAVNSEAFPALDGSLTMYHDHAIHLNLATNLKVLQGLSESLRTFAATGRESFGMFEFNQELFQKAHATMSAQIPAFNEVA